MKNAAKRFTMREFDFDEFTLEKINDENFKLIYQNGKETYMVQYVEIDD